MAGYDLVVLGLAFALQTAVPDAQVIAAAVQTAPPETAEPLTAATGASVEIEIAESLNSKTVTQGQRFAIRLTTPLLDATGRPIVPIGAEGEGEVIHARKAGFGGKAGEMILAARFIRCGSIEVALGRFKFGGIGNDRSGAVGAANAAAAGVSVVASAALVAPIAIFMIKGGQIDVPAGTRGTARLKADLQTTEEAVAACGAAVEAKGKP